MTAFLDIYDSIQRDGFSRHTLELIEHYTDAIRNGKTNFTRFNQLEHAGLCTGGSSLIGAYVVCHHARRSLETSPNAPTSQRQLTSWEIDSRQEDWVQQWAKAQGIWFDNPEQYHSSAYLYRLYCEV